MRRIGELSSVHFSGRSRGTRALRPVVARHATNTMKSKLHDALMRHAKEYEVVRELQSNERNAVHEVILDGERAVCKLGGDPDAIGREAAVVRYVRTNTPVPVPAIGAVGDGYFVADWCPGSAYDASAPRERRAERLRSVGTTLARLHEATGFDAHGDLVADGNGLRVADGRPWVDVLLDGLRSWREGLDDPRHASLGVATESLIRDHGDLFGDEDAVLINGDCAAEHPRFDGDGVVGFLDWEVARAAPAEFDLARAEIGWFESPRSSETDWSLKEALFEGYESIRPTGDRFEMRRDLYRAAVTVKALRNVDGDAANDELGEVMRSYVRERLASAADALAADSGCYL